MEHVHSRRAGAAEGAGRRETGDGNGRDMTGGEAMFCAAFPVVSDRRFQEMSRGRADRTDGDLILVVLLPKTASREPRDQPNFHQSEVDEVHGI